MSMNNADLMGRVKDRQASARRQQRGWWRRNWLWILLVLLLVILAIGGGAYWALVFRIHQLDVYQRAMQTIKADKQLQQQLGEPMHSNHWPPRSALPSARIEDREIDIRWGIHGPKAQAEAHVHARLMAGKWEADVLEVKLADGKRISLQEAGSAEADAPRFNQGPTKPENKKPEAEAPAKDINLPVPPGEPAGK
jgi:hypothetical protein